jgi:hypothetical protein
MQVLLDGDILLYEVGFICQFKDPESGDIVPSSLDKVIECIDNKIKLIQELAWADEPPIIYLTGKDNFREKIAVTKPYKGNRPSNKPFHYNNVKGWLIANYNAIVVDGIEADDAIGIEMRTREQEGYEFLMACICASRDKDLRSLHGNHLGWECGKQPQFGPRYVSSLGEIELDEKGKIRGTGLSFFYSQLITGDAVDNIQGIKGCGDKVAYKCLESCNTSREMYEAVRNLYQEKVGDNWLDLLKENAYLLWMVLELNEDGSPVMWTPPKKEK